MGAKYPKKKGEVRSFLVGGQKQKNKFQNYFRFFFLNLSDTVVVG